MILFTYRSNLQLIASLSKIVRNYTNRNFIAPLTPRGVISDTFPPNGKEISELLSSKPQVFYSGFDPTAPSLHIGNLAVIVLLIHAQRAGHSPIALIGGATGLVGDPSGKNSERPELNPTEVNENGAKLVESIKTIFKNHEDNFWDTKKGNEPLPKLKIVNNLEWYKDLSALELLSKIGRHFRLGSMLSKQSVASRLEKDLPINYTEFSYQVLQAYDWLHLKKTYNCNFQIGGHDQMGNITLGHDLIKRILNKQVYGVTVPLITSETGNKYGKTAGNAIWLDPSKTSPFEFYQFLVRSKDDQVEKFLRLFTFLQESQIESIIKKHLANPDNRTAQKELAKNLTLLVHGEKGLESALRATLAVYSEDIKALSSLTSSEVQKIFQSPSGETLGVSSISLEPGTTILDMALKAGCFKTQKDALRIISAGGFSLNYQKVNNFEEVIVPGIHILPNKITLARVGKKNYYVINWLL